MENLPMPLTKKMGYVYFVKFRELTPIYYKIGSTNNINKRMRTLCQPVNCSLDLLVYGFTLNQLNLEKIIRELIRNPNVIYHTGREFWWSMEYFQEGEIDIEMTRQALRLFCISVQEYD